MRAITTAKRGREYAALFESIHGAQTEPAGGDALLRTLNAATGMDLRRVSFQRPAPPDLRCVDSAGSPIGIEVVELVRRETLRRDVKGESLPHVWKPGEVTTAIAALLAEKDSDKYYGGPYSELIVCIHTEEPAMSVDEARSELSGAKLGSFRQITRSFLLFPYQRTSQSYPAITIEHGRARSR